MLKFEFIVNGPPVSQQARRRDRLRAWKKTVREEAEKYWSSQHKTATGWVMLQITYFYDSVLVDVDNIVKPIQDALIGLAYVDDTQITDVLVRKRNLSGNFRIENMTSTLAEGFARSNEFLHIVVIDAPDLRGTDLMANPTTNLARERLLKLAEEYREKGYEILFHPNPEDLPDFLKNYQPDMILHRGDESVVVEVKSRSTLNPASTQFLRNLAQDVEMHPGWRFELVMDNSENEIYSPKIEGSLQRHEIESRLQVARQLASQYPESALLYSWSLIEATLRLLAQKEGLSLRRFAILDLIKQLVVEGIISRSQYQLLIDALSSRNAIAHGFKTTHLNPDSASELIELTEQLLSDLNE